MQNKYASYVRPSVMLVQLIVPSFKMHIAKLVLTNAENVLTNVEKWQGKTKGGGLIASLIIYLFLPLNIVSVKLINIYLAESSLSVTHL
jgi:hypothetical protein